MSELTDDALERLSNLLASGSMKHAPEIARLLGQELHEQRPKPNPLFAALGSFLSNDQLRIR